MKRQILTEPNHELRIKSESVKHKQIESEEVQQLIDDMIETMASADGIGLAAPQIGVRFQIIVVETKQNGPQAFINPKITGRSFMRTQAEEGCLSIPGVTGVVKRYRRVTVKAHDRHGKKIKIRTSGLEAVIFQHEIDHLHGILFTDRAHHLTSAPRL